MPNFTVSIPKKLKEKLDKHPKINWSEVLRRALEKKADKLLLFEKLENGTFTKEDLQKLRG
ncbi:MAG: hypothetical protein ABIB71_03955 [Candidatus Woesearchaeota archaeon]